MVLEEAMVESGSVHTRRLPKTPSGHLWTSRTLGSNPACVPILPKPLFLSHCDQLEGRDRLRVYRTEANPLEFHGLPIPATCGGQTGNGHHAKELMVQPNMPRFVRQGDGTRRWLRCCATFGQSPERTVGSTV
jgi:hypothetical protein